MNDKNTKDLTPNPSPKERGTAASPGYMTVDILKAKEFIQRAKNNRKEATEAEALLWQFLRNRNLGEKFRRQHPIGNYIPDFVCLEKRLIIEVDGAYHNSPDQAELDDNRTFELEQKHLYKVIRLQTKRF